MSRLYASISPTVPDCQGNTWLLACLNLYHVKPVERSKHKEHTFNDKRHLLLLLTLHINAGEAKKSISARHSAFVPGNNFIIIEEGRVLASEQRAISTKTADLHILSR